MDPNGRRQARQRKRQCAPTTRDQPGRLRFGASAPAAEPLRLDCGKLLAPFSIAYQTYGTLNAAKSNAILICHALTGDQYVASANPGDRQARLVGDAGRSRQADRHQPLLRHLLQRARRLHGLDRSGLDQSARPASPTGSTFPSSPSATWCDAQVRLIDHLGIDQLFCVIGGSMGGMQVLEWAARYRGARASRPCRSPPRAWHSSQNIAFHEVGRQAVMADPDWRGGNYHRARQGARATASPWRAWPRTSPICRRRRCTGSSAATCRTATRDVRVRRRLPGRELSAPPGLDLRRPLRRQQLPLHHPRDGLFRPRRPSTAACWPTPFAAPRRASASSRSRQRLAVSDARKPRRSCRR